AGRAVDVRRHRPAVRPRQPGHDLPHGRGLEAQDRSQPRPSGRRARARPRGGHGRPLPGSASGRLRASGSRSVPGDAAARAHVRSLAAGRRTSSSPTGRGGRRRHVRVRAAQLRRPGGLLPRAGTGRAPRWPHCPAGCRRAPQPGAAARPRRLLRQGRPPHRRRPLRPCGLPLPPQVRRVPARAPGDARVAALGRLRRRAASAPHRRPGPAGHGHQGSPV
ncbi:MAG: Demethylmenaquinone methyltransferase, partial [uncultured Acidimicrobiales bacterium]